MKRYLCFIVFLLIGLCAWSQPTSLFNNEGAGLYMMPGSYMIINNDSLFNHTGIIQNAGDLRVAGSIFNTDTMTGNPSGSTGLYDIGGDWVNSGTFLAYQDSVMLNGDARGSAGASGAQMITGAAVTPFYDLILAGTSGSVKTQTVNATVSGILDLRGNELATQANEMLVLNTSPSAITKAAGATGYVSSLSTGRLSRATDAAVAYLYPTGIPSSLTPADPFYYRPVEMTPTSSASDVYGVRLADYPTADGYDVSKFDDSLCSVNPHYYHLMYHSAGSDPVGIRMYFDPTTDGDWTAMAHWGNAGPWAYMGPPASGSGYGFSSLAVGNWSDFTPAPFALASRKITVTAGPAQEISIGQSISLNATVNTTSITNIQWTPEATLSSSTVLDPTATPVQTTEYVITVTNNTGCSASDSVNITVLPSLLLIPTAFSPNQDGKNDLFKPLNQNLDKLVFQVYDRWGQKVYETDVIGDGWDGTYKGVKQDMGVFIWQAQYQLAGSTQKLTASGNVTLMR